MTEVIVNRKDVDLSDVKLDFALPWAGLPIVDVLSAHLVSSNRAELDDFGLSKISTIFQHVCTNLPWLPKASTMIREKLGFHCVNCHLEILEEFYMVVCTEYLGDMDAMVKGTKDMTDEQLSKVVDELVSCVEVAPSNVAVLH